MHVRYTQAKTTSQLPIVCLHMSPLSGSSFEKFMSIAGQDRTIIAPDYHGYGASSRPPEFPEVGIEDYAHTTWQALDRMDVNRVNLLGHHTGSKVAAEMAYQQPERVEDIVMISAGVRDPKVTNGVARQFSPPKWDKEGAGIRKFWRVIGDYLGPDADINFQLRFFSDAIRAGSAQKWALRASNRYGEKFVSVLEALSHRVFVLNPNDDLYQVTPRAMPHLRSGSIHDKPEWKPDFLDDRYQEVAACVLGLLDGKPDEAQEEGALDPLEAS